MLSYKKIIWALFLILAFGNLSYADTNNRVTLTAKNYGVENIRSLLEQGYKLGAGNEYGASAFLVAASLGYTDVVFYLLEGGVDINFRSKRGNTALLIATKKQHWDIVELLLLEGIALNVQNKGFFSSLFGKTFDVDAKDSGGQTALILATTSASVEIVQLFISAGADVNAKSNYGFTALINGSDSVEMIQLLVSEGVDVNAQSKLWGWTALMFSVEYGSVDTVKTLISLGADVSVKDIDGYTALDLAIKGGREDIAEFLRSIGAR